MIGEFLSKGLSFEYKNSGTIKIPYGTVIVNEGLAGVLTNVLEVNEVGNVQLEGEFVFVIPGNEYAVNDKIFVDIDGNIAQSGYLLGYVIAVDADFVSVKLGQTNNIIGLVEDFIKDFITPPVEVSDSETTAVTLEEAKANTIYIYGTLESLVITAVEVSNLETKIYFGTDADFAYATDLTLPATLKTIGTVQPAASKNYVMTILNNIAKLEEITG
jgi:hypothetical protein